MYILLLIASLLSCSCDKNIYIRDSTQNLIENDEISITTWNLGYGGLGKNEDFFMDGGKGWLPSSKKAVQLYIDGINTHIREMDVDYFFFQEASKRSIITYQIDQLKSLRDSLPNYDFFFESTYKSRCIPPFNLSVGLAVFARQSSIHQQEIISLPLEDTGNLLLRIKNLAIISYIPIADTDIHWALINIHLSAFDESANDRYRQIENIREIAEKEYAKGNCVVIGGDWNFRLVDTNFPNQTDQSYLFWIHDLPKNFFSENWKWAIDRLTPTVRTLNEPYEIEKNYTTIIDGFLVSPNVNIDRVFTYPLDFAYSDHNPVMGVFQRSESRRNL